MLRSLTVNNFILIDSLHVDFEPGFTIITGETGAGKSILLGALSLLQGAKADVSLLLDADRKCVVEGVFEVKDHQLESFFAGNELDFEPLTIIRREILDSGRSRAFVNDTPVALSLLKELAEHFIDIHSQHQNLKLNDGIFQLNIVDALAGTTEEVEHYSVDFKQYKKLLTELREIKDEIARSNEEADLWQYQFKLLEDAKLKADELTEVEEECSTLSNAEEIKLNLDSVSQHLNDDTQGILPSIKEILAYLHKISTLTSRAAALHSRMESCFIELKDIAAEVDRINDSVELDPDKLVRYRERIDLLYGLMQRFKVQDCDQLIEIREQLRQKLDHVSNADEVVKEKERQIELFFNQLKAKASAISAKRKSIIKPVETKTAGLLQDLGMPNAVFKIDIQPLELPIQSGVDDVKFLFSANSSGIPQEIGKVASGGEISRLMLAIKAVVANSLQLPTIVFDEIDSGISGEVAGKMARIIREMSNHIQIIDITHLPQVAARGNHHFLVYKNDDGKKVRTGIRLLNDNERVEHIARMLSGMQVTDAAFEHARQLLSE
jgi:DNA repair protein RecN (Recombination protein N)